MLLVTLFCAITATTPTTTHALKFLTMGDWGDDKATLSANIGKFMNEEAKGAATVLALGDNFYNTGVKSVNDTQFKTKFQDVFSGSNLKKIPFLVVGGNHDYYGKIDAQVEYSNQDPTKRWRFPSYYYTKSFQQDGVKVLFVMIDTWRLNGGDSLLATDHTGRIWLRSHEVLQHAVKHQLLPMETAMELRHKFQVDETSQPETDTKQWSWLKQVLFSVEANSSDWVVVAGHFPVHSASMHEHGDTATLVTQLEPLLQAANVPVFISGHDHILQHIKKNNGPTHYFGSGAGGKKHDDVHKSYSGLQAYQTGCYGFTKHEVSKTEMKTTFFASVNDTKKVATYEFIQTRRNGGMMQMEKRLRGNGDGEEAVVLAIE